MELTFCSLKPHFFPSNRCIYSPLYSSVFQVSPPLLGKRKLPVRYLRFRSEFDAKVNGVLSADSDPRFLDKQKALEAAMADINNSFGKGSVTRLGSAGGALVYMNQKVVKRPPALHAIAEVQVVRYRMLEGNGHVGLYNMKYAPTQHEDEGFFHELQHE